MTTDDKMREIEAWRHEMEVRQDDLNVDFTELMERGEALMRRAAAAPPAPSALERLRERVQAVAEAKDEVGRYIWDEATRYAMQRVLEWIDEETNNG